MHSALSHFRIAGVAVTTGFVERDFIADGLAAGIDRAQLERVSAAIGLRKRLVAPAGVTALDLCEDAARRLLSALDVDPSSIDAVVFVTQTPDHPQPNDASLLHGRLGLSKAAMAFDLSHGCSGWVYGLHQAALLCAHGGAARVLLCAGDTLSRLTHPADRSVDPIFGDAGSAALVERTGVDAPWHFIFGTDGSAADVIAVPAGGARSPASESTRVVKRDAEGHGRSEENLRMDGAAVMSFTLREVPGAVKAVLTAAGWKAPEACAFHQANRFVLSALAKACGLDLASVPMDLTERFGNLSSASVPAVLAHAYGATLSTASLRLLACGYGVGLSWAAAAGPIGPCVCLPMLPLRR
ncbi:MAG: 3-oxoacyl-ACP synthase III family protein [Verrucomicrobiota bacterium]